MTPRDDGRSHSFHAGTSYFPIRERFLIQSYAIRHGSRTIDSSNCLLIPSSGDGSYAGGRLSHRRRSGMTSVDAAADARAVDAAATKSRDYAADVHRYDVADAASSFRSSGSQSPVDRSRSLD
jgi:hypothetical protein